jgi:hypothetical protein
MSRGIDKTAVPAGPHAGRQAGHGVRGRPTSRTVDVRKWSMDLSANRFTPPTDERFNAWRHIGIASPCVRFILLSVIAGVAAPASALTAEEIFAQINRNLP